LSASTFIRQFHRWTSVGFVAAFIFTSVVLSLKLPLPWAVYSPLPFLFLLAVTGIYMFVLPYLMRRRQAAGAEARAIT
jgi:hypothetical protein